MAATESHLRRCPCNGMTMEAAYRAEISCCCGYILQALDDLWQQVAEAPRSTYGTGGLLWRSQVLDILGGEPLDSDDQNLADWRSEKEVQREEVEWERKQRGLC